MSPKTARIGAPKEEIIGQANKGRDVETTTQLCGGDRGLQRKHQETIWTYPISQEGTSGRTKGEWQNASGLIRRGSAKRAACQISGI